MWRLLLTGFTLTLRTSAIALSATSNGDVRSPLTIETITTSTRLLAVKDVETGDQNLPSDTERTQAAAKHHSAQNEKRRLTFISSATEGVTSGGKWAWDKASQLGMKLGSYVPPSTKEVINKSIKDGMVFIRDNIHGVDFPPPPGTKATASQKFFEIKSTPSKGSVTYKNKKKLLRAQLARDSWARKYQHSPKLETIVEGDEALT